MNAPQDPPDTEPSSSDSLPLRLRLGTEPVGSRFDGAWWPYSRDLTAELGPLIDGLPPELGRPQRVGYSPPDWDEAVRSVPIGRGRIKTSSFPNDDTHMMVVSTMHDRSIRLLVVPPHFTQDQAEEAMLAASAPGNARSGSEVLLQAADQLLKDRG